jgi:hypothetical protein
MTSLRNRLAIVTLVMVGVILSSPARAQAGYSLKDYRTILEQGANGKAALSVYLHGFLLSVRATNIAYTEHGKPGKYQFCPGDKEDVGEIVPMDKVMAAVERHVETLPESEDESQMPFAPIVFEAMRRRFPCP